MTFHSPWLDFEPERPTEGGAKSAKSPPRSFGSFGTFGTSVPGASDASARPPEVGDGEVRTPTRLDGTARGAENADEVGCQKCQKPSFEPFGTSIPGPSAPLPPLPTEPCFACRGRRWWLRPVDRQWVCAICHPPVLPEAAEVLAPLADLREALRHAAGALAGELGWPRLPLDPVRTVLPGTGPWRAFLDRADLPTLRLAIDRLREGLATLEDADGR